MIDYLNRYCVALLAALVSAAILAAPAHAMKVQSRNLTQLISDSSSIIHGTVTSVTDGIDSNNVPYTEVTIAISSIAKGDHVEGSSYTFRQFGLLRPRDMGNGRLRVALTPEGFPRWREGETVLAFLRAPASITGLQTTAGVAQGKFSQINGQLINDYNNAGLFDGVRISDALLDDETRNMLTQPGAVDAAAFMDLIGRAVAENWIETGDMQ